MIQEGKKLKQINSKQTRREWLIGEKLAILKKGQCPLLANLKSAVRISKEFAETRGHLITREFFPWVF